MSKCLPYHREIFLDYPLKNKYLYSCCSLYLFEGELTVLWIVSTFVFLCGLSHGHLSLREGSCYSSVAMCCTSNAHLGLCPWCLMWLGRSRVRTPQSEVAKDQWPKGVGRAESGHQKQRSKFLSESYWANIHPASSPHGFEMSLLQRSQLDKLAEKKKNSKGQGCSSILDRNVQISSEP